MTRQPTRRRGLRHGDILTGLLVCSLANFGSSLVTGKIRVSGPRGQARSWDSDTTCGLEDNAENTAIENVNATHSSSTRTRRRNEVIPKTIDFSSLDDKERRELDWIIRNTSKIIGPESQPLGTMSGQSIQLTFNVMKAWGRRASKKESKAPHVVERLLQRLLKEKDAGNRLVRIDTMAYNIVLDAWSYSSEEGSAERCEEILLQMERMYQEGDESVKPDEGSYNAVVKAYVKNGSRSISATKVESIVIRMEQPEKQVSPTRRSYNLLLYALANSSLEDAASRAETTLHKMLNRYKENGDESVKPDINSFNQVLGAFARGRNEFFEARMQSIYEELLQLPEDMDILPNTDTFNAVMGGWLKSDHPEALSRVQQTLKVMEKCFDEGNLAAKPDRITINTLTAAYAKNGNNRALEKAIELRSSMEEKYRIQPDTVSHNIVVDSWCKSGRADAPERVMELLNTIEREFKEGKNDLKPDGYTYSSVIGCYVKFGRPDAPQKGEEILKRMQSLYRNFAGDPVSTSVFNAVINAWASSDSKNALRRVKALLRMMEENNGKDPSIPLPNRISYNTVIKAMRDGTAEDAKYAESILTNLETKGQRQSNLLPDSYSYTSVITAYGRSNASNKARKGLDILERMIHASQNGNMAATPTVHSFNAALNACAFVEGNDAKKREAFEIAMKVYDLLKQNDAPDHTSYGTLLRACATLLDSKDKTREKTVDEVFSNACQTGNVGRLVVTQMKFAATPEQHIRLFGRDIIERINVKELPRAWTRNVRENRKGGA